MDNLTRIKSLETQLQQGRDSALLRFALGQNYLDMLDYENAIVHLRHACTLNPKYTAAWKLLGKAYAADNQREQAIDSYETGLKIALENGDKQAGKEIQVFLRRLRRMS